MSESTRIETINELKIWLEGEFKLVSATQETNAGEMRTLRQTVHNTNSAVSLLTALDIPGKLESFRDEVKNHDSYIKKLADEQAALRLTMRIAYIAAGASGAAVGAVITVALRAYEVFGG